MLSDPELADLLLALLTRRALSDAERRALILELAALRRELRRQPPTAVASSMSM